MGTIGDTQTHQQTSYAEKNYPITKYILDNAQLMVIGTLIDDDLLTRKD